MRDDIQGALTDCPQSLVVELIKLGGTNPFGEPNLRVCLSQNRVMKQAAEWHDWDTNLTVQERGGMVSDDEGNIVASQHKPNRVVAEMRTIPRYPICDCPEGVLVDKKSGKRAEAGDCEECSGVRGWIIEKWWPAHVIAGTPEQWYAAKVKGTDLPRLGPYPTEGAYRRVPRTKATMRVPSIEQIAAVINYLNRCAEQAPMSREQFILECNAVAEYENEKYKREDRERIKQQISESLDPLKGSSLAAGRQREVYAKRMRERGIPVGHVGA